MLPSTSTKSSNLPQAKSPSFPPREASLLPSPRALKTTSAYSKSSASNLCSFSQVSSPRNPPGDLGRDQGASASMPTKCGRNARLGICTSADRQVLRRDFSRASLQARMLLALNGSFGAASSGSSRIATSSFWLRHTLLGPR